MTAGREAAPGPPSVRGGFEPGRLFGVDAARGLALLGMFVAHLVPSTSERIVDGRSAILFATVAGISLGLLSGGGAESPADRGATRARIVIRGGALLVLGVLLHLLRPPLAGILDFYGVGLLLLAPLLFARRWVLVLVAAACAIAGPLLVGTFTDAMPFGSLVLPLQPLAFWFAYGSYPLLVWLAYLATGLVAARSGLHRTRTRAALVIAGGVAAIAGYGAAHLIPGVSAAAHSDSTAEAVASGGLAIAIVGTLLMLCDAPGRAGRMVRVALWPVAAAGSMVLTLYTAHVLVLAGIRAAIGDGFSIESYPTWLLPAFVIVALVVGSLWRAFIGRGPLEAALRSLALWATRSPILE